MTRTLQTPGEPITTATSATTSAITPADDMTIATLRAQLDALGIKYTVRTSKTDLLALLADAQKPAVSSAVAPTAILSTPPTPAPVQSNVEKFSAAADAQNTRAAYTGGAQLTEHGWIVK